jgi:hypothetical protein
MLWASTTVVRTDSQGRAEFRPNTWVSQRESSAMKPGEAVTAVATNLETGDTFRILQLRSHQGDRRLADVRAVEREGNGGRFPYLFTDGY